VSLNRKEAGIKDMFREIKKQTGYTIICDAAILKKSDPVTVRLKNVPLQNALNAILSDQGLTYIVDGTSIVVRAAEERRVKAVAPSIVTKQQQVAGAVTDGEGMPLLGVSITVKGTNIATATNEK